MCGGNEDISKSRYAADRQSETRDGKKSYDSPPHSKEMMKLNKAFGRMHGASAMMNLASMLITMWYGAELAARFQ